MSQAENDLSDAKREVGARIAKLRTILGEGQQAFSERVDISVRTISRAENGEGDVMKQAAKVALAVPGVSHTWLVTGRGPMWERDAPAGLGVAESEALTPTVAYLTERVRELERMMRAEAAMPAEVRQIADRIAQMPPGPRAAIVAGVKALLRTVSADASDEQ